MKLIKYKMKKPKVRGIFSGEKGQRIFNILYSIGASVVILGALFKILHASGADIMLIIGMGTEAVIFFLSAFDEKQTGSGETMVASQDRNDETLPPQPHVDMAQVEEVTAEYVRQMNELNVTLAKLQTSLTQNLQGLNAMYELQLRDAVSQLDSASKMHRETEQMTENIKQLNAIYERMLNAMQNK